LKVTSKAFLLILGGFFFFVAFLIQLEQYAIWGHWWDWDQIHHETFSLAFAFAGVVLLVIALYGYRLQKAKSSRRGSMRISQALTVVWVLVLLYVLIMAGVILTLASEYSSPQQVFATQQFQYFMVGFVILIIVTLLPLLIRKRGERR
jgi:uncharacterized membrane protein